MLGPLLVAILIQNQMPQSPDLSLERFMISGLAVLAMFVTLFRKQFFTPYVVSLLAAVLILAVFIFKPDPLVTFLVYATVPVLLLAFWILALKQKKAQ